MSTAVLAPLADTRPADGGAPARRAVVRWAWRLFRREWRQQFLILALITVAVAATIVGSAVATNDPPPKNFGFGTAQDSASFTTYDAHAASVIASLEHRFGRVEVIENETQSIPGSINTYQLRAQDPHGPFSGPMLSLVSGHYPSGADEVAVTSGVASAFHLRVGGTWRVGGVERQVVGIVENPQSLLDEFALVAPGQVTHPTRSHGVVRRPGRSAELDRQPTCRPPPRSRSRTRSTPRRSRSPPSCSACCSSPSSRSAASPCSRSGASARSGCSSRPARRTATSVSSSARTARSSVSSVRSSASSSGSSSGSPTDPSLEQSSHHVIGVLALSWAVVVAAMVLAVVAAYFAASRPARAITKVPIVQALSGRPAPPRQIHRSALPGIVFLVARLLVARLLRWHEPRQRERWCTRAPLRDRPPHPRAHPARAVLPVADGAPRPPRADRDPAGAARSRPVSGALGLGAGGDQPRRARRRDRDAGRRRPATGTSSTTRVRTSPRTSSPSTPTRRRRASTIVRAQRQGSARSGQEPHRWRPRLPRSSATQRRARSPRASARSSSPSRRRMRSLERDPTGVGSWNGAIYVATPQLLRAFGITASEIDPNADILSSRPGLSGVSGLGLRLRIGWQVRTGDPQTLSRCAATGCLAHPVIQEVGALPSGTSAPNTVITEHAMKRVPHPGEHHRLAGPGNTALHRRPDQQRRARGVDDAALGRVEERPADLVRRHHLGDDLRDRHRPRRARHVGRARPERDGERPPHARGDRCVQLHAAHADRRDGRGARLSRGAPRGGRAATSA